MIKRIYGNLLMRINQITSKRSVMELSALFDTPTMTKNHHIVTALRYVAVEAYYGQNDFGKALYIRANCFDSDAEMQKDLERFDALIKSIETKGYDMRSGVFVDLDGKCFNGTHRLALCVWFGVKKIPVLIINRHLTQLSVAEMKSYYNLSDEDYQRLEQAYQRMRERLQKN